MSWENQRILYRDSRLHLIDESKYLGSKFFLFPSIQLYNQKILFEPVEQEFILNTIIYVMVKLRPSVVSSFWKFLSLLMQNCAIIEYQKLSIWTALASF